MAVPSAVDRKALLCGIFLILLSGARSLLFAQDKFVFTDDFQADNRDRKTTRVGTIATKNQPTQKQNANHDSREEALPP